MEKNNMRHEAWGSLRDGDFQEDDVWDVLDGYHQSSSFMISEPSFSNQSSLSTEPQKIPKRHTREGMAHITQHSVPANVPDWSIVHKRATEKVDVDNENVSAEEYFMRRSRSSSSSSFMEGVGRKLKGRDLSQVRNTVLKKTGFLE